MSTMKITKIINRLKYKARSQECGENKVENQINNCSRRIRKINMTNERKSIKTICILINK